MLSSLSPNTGPPAGGNLVTINGTNLEGATFRFGTATAGIVSASSTQVTVRAPAGTGTQEVRATASGLTSGPLFYTYAISSAPKITSVTPGTAWENLSATITLKTDQFLPASGVRFNGSAVNFTQSGRPSRSTPRPAEGHLPDRGHVPERAAGDPRRSRSSLVHLAQG